jgi:signal transduction histidine kinase
VSRERDAQADGKQLPLSPSGRGVTLVPRSLALRIIALSTIWAIVTMIVTATIISTLYRQASERGFNSLLSAHLFNLIGSVGVSESGALTGSVDLGDLRFSEPGSGWYWAVEPVSGGLTGQLRSLSMTRVIASPSAIEVPFNSEFQRSYQTDGIAGERLQIFESEFVLDAQNRVARFRVMGNRTELENEIGAFQGRLFTYLSIFGVGMVAINAIAIMLGLRPLAKVREALSKVREGTARRLDGTFPAEIEPLANETNALIENNKRIVERSRTQVGNLAHSLKTPLAVLLNEARIIGGEKGRLIEGQASAMHQQLEYYLQRARIAAQRDSVVYRTPLSPSLKRMVRVMEKLNPKIQVALELPAQEILFAGEREDFEEIIGNLLENAMKWGRNSVLVSTKTIEGPEADPGMFELAIEDDGPGIPEYKAREALKRGKRLDETKPGTGLGLAIVSDLVNEYGGKLGLERSTLGGLKASVQLRTAH